MSRAQPHTRTSRPGSGGRKQPPDWLEIERAPWFQEFGMDAREAVLDKWQGDVRDWLGETGQWRDEAGARLDQDVERIRERLRPTVGERVASGAAAAGRGFAEMVPGVMEGVSVAAQSLRGAGKPVDETVLYQAAQSAREWAHEAMPVDPRVRDSFWNEIVPQAFGSFGSYILGGGVAGAGARVGLRAATRGAARQAPDRISVFGNLAREPERAIAQAQTTAQTGFALSAAGTSGMGQAYTDARQHGAEEEDARQAGRYGLGPGMFQVFGAIRALNRFNRASRGQLERSYREYLRQGGQGAIDEFIAESGGQVGFNAIAREIYDEERDLLFGAVKSGAAGGIAGFAASFLLSAAGGRRSGAPQAGDLQAVYRQARDSAAEPGAEEQLADYRERRQEDAPIIERVWNRVLEERRGRPDERTSDARERLRRMTPDRQEPPAQERAQPPARRAPPRDFSEAMPSAVGTLREMDLSAAELDALDRNLRYVVSKPKTWRAKPENVSRILGQTVLRRLRDQDKQPLVDEFSNQQRGREALEAFRGQIETLAQRRRERDPAPPRPEPQAEPAQPEFQVVPPERWHGLTWPQVQEQARAQGIGSREARRRHAEAIQRAEDQGELVSDLIRAPYRQVLDQAATERERADLERRAEEGDEQAQAQLMREQETEAIAEEGDPDTELLQVARRVRLPSPAAAQAMNLRGESEALQRHFSRAEIPRYFTTRERTDAQILEQFAEEGHRFETVAELFDAIETRMETGREVHGRGDSDAIRFARRPPEEAPEAPAEYLGRMEGARGRTVDLYNLTEAVGETPADSTVSADFLRRAGYRVPEQAAEGEATRFARRRPGDARQLDLGLEGAPAESKPIIDGTKNRTLAEIESRLERGATDRDHAMRLLARYTEITQAGPRVRFTYDRGSVTETRQEFEARRAAETGLEDHAQYMRMFDAVERYDRGEVFRWPDGRTDFGARPYLWARRGADAPRTVDPSVLARQMQDALPLRQIAERAGITVEIVERQAGLPENVRAAAEGFIVDGVAVGRRVYLVAENLETLKYAEQKLAHEVVGHLGLRTVLGERFDGFLDEAYGILNDDPAMASRIERITSDYEIDLATAEGRRLLAEELIAEMAEGGPVNRTVLQRILEAVRRFLREMGLDVQMSEADILNALDAARALTMPEGEGQALERASRRQREEDPFEETRRLQQELQESVDNLENRFGANTTFEVPWPGGAERDARIIVSPEPGDGNRWRYTIIDRDGPAGHGIRASWREVVEDIVKDFHVELSQARQSRRRRDVETIATAIVDHFEEIWLQGSHLQRSGIPREIASGYREGGLPRVKEVIDDFIAASARDGVIRHRPYDPDGFPVNYAFEPGEGRHGGERMEDLPVLFDSINSPEARRFGREMMAEVTRVIDQTDARFARRRDEDLNDSERAVRDTVRVPPEELTTRRLQERFEWLSREIDEATEAGNTQRVNQLLGPRSEARVELQGRREARNRDLEDNNPELVDREPTTQERELSAAGIDTNDLIAPTLQRMLTLRAFHESGTDTLHRSNLFRPLAVAIENQLDKRDAYRGSLYGFVRPGIRALRQLPRPEQRRVRQEFEQFWAENDVGDKGVAAEILERAHPNTRELVDQWRIAAAEAFRIARAVGVKIQDPESGQVQEMGQVQDYFPRMLNQEAQRALAEPHRHPETWNRLVDALIAEGHIQQREEAQRYINDYFTDETTNDFFANIERHRKQPLPRIFYDYSISRAVDYINRFSERTSQIEFYGQVVQRGDRDLFDQYIAETTDRTSREFVDAIRKRIYNQNTRDFATNVMGNLNMLAAGSMLGNPLTATRNLLGGMTLTAENYGLLRAARELFHEIRNYNRHATEAYERGVLKSDLLHVIRDNDDAHTTVFGLQLSDGLRKYTDFMMKFGGYTPTENFIRVHAMLTSKSFIRDAIREANQNATSPTALRYRAFFQRNHIDFDSILREGLDGPAGDQAIRRMVKIPQGSYEVDNVPVFIDTSMGRFLFKYQKFGTQVSRFFFRNMFSPFIRSLGPGENVRVRMPDGTETTARVRNFVPLLRFFTVGAIGGLGMQGLISLLFGSHPRGPNLEEIETALDDDETARGLALMMDRAYMAWLYSGGAGVYGNYIQAGLDVYRRQRVRSPADPPGLDALSRVYELGLRYFEQGTLTRQDIQREVLEFNSGYRAFSHFTFTQADRAGVEWRSAQLYTAWRERQWAQGVIGRYADEMGIEGRIRAAGRMSRSEMSPTNQRLYNAVMLGNAAEARAIAEDYLRGLGTRDAMQRAYQSMQSSIRARQPLRVISSAGEADRLLFLEWAEQNLGPGDMERLRRLDGTFRDAAIRAGLLTGDETRAEREIQRREWRTRELPEHQRARAVREVIR